MLEVKSTFRPFYPLRHSPRAPEICVIDQKGNKGNNPIDEITHMLSARIQNPRLNES
jgi:hypothetical protein